MIAPHELETFYFGGGTPSLLAPGQLQLILDSITTRFKAAPSPEVTLEINPGSASGRNSTPTFTVDGRMESAPADLAAFRKLGVNRASFGAQTFDDDELRHLGRTHSAADIESTFRQLCDAGFENINFDLIAGLPGQTLAGWMYNLDCALELRPEHLSLYLLDIHEGTPLADQIKRGARPQPDEDLAAEMYRVMIECVCDAGYEHYEISNFCLPGYASQHNIKYWTGAPYYGFGCSAHSYDGRLRRWSNERDVTRYSSLVEADASPIVDRTELTASEARAEAMFLGLRMMDGVDVAGLIERYGSDSFVEYQRSLEKFREAGLIEINGDLVRLTRSGALLSNEVFAAFV